MTFCPECGKPVAPNAKFCRICGASQLDDAQTVPVPTPVAAPAPVVFPPQPPQPRQVPPQPAIQPVVQSVCSSCGSPLSPSEKFCGICGSRAGQIAPAAPPAPSFATPVYAPAPAPSQFQPAAPVMGESAGVRTCTACGNIIKPGDKYCSKCLVMVRDNQPPAAATVRSPVQPSPAAASGTYVCASCGSPITGTEKFCGICGTTVAARAPAPTQPQPAQKICSACGAPVNNTTKFCGGCGAPVGASFRPAPVASPIQYAGVAPAVSQGGEQVIGVIGNARKMKMLGAAWDTYGDEAGWLGKNFFTFLYWNFSGYFFRIG
ncbi:MAG: zinc-ribbon domain-containing protein [Methanomicrobiales archaeon]